MTDTPPPLFYLSQEGEEPRDGYVVVDQIGGRALCCAAAFYALLAQPLRELAALAHGFYCVPAGEADGEHFDPGYVEALRTPGWVVCSTSGLVPLARGLWAEALEQAKREAERDTRALKEEVVSLRWQVAQSAADFDSLATLALHAATRPTSDPEAVPEVEANSETEAAFKLAVHLAAYLTTRRGLSTEDALAVLRKNGGRALSIGWERRDELLD